MWRKSSASAGNGQCVEVWIKSSASLPEKDCVEVGRDNVLGYTLIRDSKDPYGPQLEFTPSEWAAFLEGVKAGEFD